MMYYNVTLGWGSDKPLGAGCTEVYETASPATPNGASMIYLPRLLLFKEGIGMFLRVTGLGWANDMQDCEIPAEYFERGQVRDSFMIDVGLQFFGGIDKTEPVRIRVENFSAAALVVRGAILGNPLADDD